jgi:2-oxoglutarate ferredoxin oxidoreductase subunit gamma
MRTDIRFAAFGGQGMILAGLILGEGAILDGRNAVQTQSYGPESRGGAARAEVIIADEEIDYPMIEEADYLVALSQPGYDKYAPHVREESTIIIDRDMVATDKQLPPGRIFKLPFARTADKLGNRIVANIVMLGSVCAITEVVSKENLKMAIESNIPDKFLELNLRAFSEGYSIGRKALEKKEQGEQ